jgi:hypothetical protein
MRPELAERGATRERFQREGRAAAAVEHDHIVPVYQVGEADGTPFLAMPLLAGETLEDRLARGPVPMAEQLTIARQVADGLAAAHAAGLIHRDIKPSNVWLEANPDGSFKRVRLLDFGLARSAREDGQLTGTGTVMGTPAYMAPEQARDSAKVDHRADLFSLGGVLYRMATGQPAFAGSDVFTLLTSIATTTPPAPHLVNPAVPRRLSDLIVRLLAKEAKDRPASAADVARELAAVAADPGPPTRRPRRGRLVAAAVLLALIGGGAALYGKQVVRVVTNKGELVVTVDDPDVEVVVKQGGVEIRDTAKGRERTYVLTAGDGEVEFRDRDGGATGLTKKFRITRGGRDAVTVATGELAANKVGRRPVAATDRAAAEWVLRHGGLCSVEVSAGGRRQTVRAGEPLPDGPFELRQFHLSDGPGMGEDDVRKIQGLGALEEARFTKCGPSDNAVAAMLRVLPALTRLHLQESGTTNETVARIANAGPGRLTELSLRDNRGVTDAGAARLGALRRLRVLDLTGTAVTAAGVKALAAALPGCRIASDHGAVGPSGLADPERRVAEWVLGKGGSVAVLAGGKRGEVKKATDLPAGPFAVRGVDLQGEVTDADLENLRGAARLFHLFLHDVPVTDAGLARLAAMPGLAWLHTLTLRGLPVSDAGLAHLPRFPRLRSLTIRQCAGLTDAGLAHLPRVSRLSYLSATHTPFTDAGLVHLAECKLLSVLNVAETGVTVAGVKTLAAALPACIIKSGHGEITPTRPYPHNIAAVQTVLGLGGRVTVSAPVWEGVVTRPKDLPDAFDSVMAVDLTGVAAFNDGGVPLLTGLRFPERIGLRGTGVSAAGVRKLAAALPDCVIESDHGTFGPVSDRPPARDAYPGELVAYETFDGPKDAKPVPPEALARAGTPTGVENGATVIHFVKLGEGNTAVRPFGGPAADVAFAARLRGTNATALAEFRTRKSVRRWSRLEFETTAAGGWVLRWVVWEPAAAKGWQLLESRELARSGSDDPDLAVGKWFTLSARSQGQAIEVSANGRRLARVENAGLPDAEVPPDAGAVRLGGRVAPGGPAKFEIDHVAVWKLPAAGLTEEQKAAVYAVAAAGIEVRATAPGRPGTVVRPDPSVPWDRVTQLYVWARPDKNPLADPKAFAALKALPEAVWHPTDRNLTVTGAVTDDQFKALVGMAGVAPVRQVTLDDTPLTDAVMDSLRFFNPTEVAITRCPKVTDNGLAYLHQLRGLERVTVKGTKATAAGVKKLAEALPAGCSFASDFGTFGPPVGEPKK